MTSTCNSPPVTPTRHIQDKYEPDINYPLSGLLLSGVPPLIRLAIQCVALRSQELTLPLFKSYHVVLPHCGGQQTISRLKVDSDTNDRVAPVSTSIGMGQSSTITVTLRGRAWPGESKWNMGSSSISSSSSSTWRTVQPEHVPPVLPSACFNTLSLNVLVAHSFFEVTIGNIITCLATWSDNR